MVLCALASDADALVRSAMGERDNVVMHVRLANNLGVAAITAERFGGETAEKLGHAVKPTTHRHQLVCIIIDTLAPVVY